MSTMQKQEQEPNTSETDNKYHHETTSTTDTIPKTSSNEKKRSFPVDPSNDVVDLTGADSDTAQQQDVVDLTTTTATTTTHCERPAKRPHSTATASAPVIANPPFSSFPKQMILYLCLDETADSFQKGLQKCETLCDPNVHEHCFQRDGTRHISMWQGLLNGAQVQRLVNETKEKTKELELPIAISFQNGWNPWTAGNYLGVKQDSVRCLKQVVQSMNLPHGKVSCDHLSLYRKRGLRTGKQALEKVRKGLQDHPWGTLSGVSIRVKELGGPYEECHVLMQATEPNDKTMD